MSTVTPLRRTTRPFRSIVAAAVPTPDHAEFRLIRTRALGEPGDRLAQIADVIGMQQGLDMFRRHLELLRIDAEDPVLALVPHPVAVDPVPIPGPHLAGGDRHAAPLFAFDQLGG
jgi:hypothetical protein